MLKRSESIEIKKDLNIQKLPGSIKTKWAMNYKFEMDRAILNALQI